MGITIDEIRLKKKDLLQKIFNSLPKEAILEYISLTHNLICTIDIEYIDTLEIGDEVPRFIIKGVNFNSYIKI